MVGWGRFPSPSFALSGISGIAAGEDHCLAITSNGTIIAWGGDEGGQIDVPASLAGVTSVHAGWNYSLALAGGTAAPGFTISNPTLSGSSFTVKVPTQSGKSYSLRYKSSLTGSTWTTFPPVSGNGSLITVTDP